MRLAICMLAVLTLSACGRVAPVAATQMRSAKAAVRVVAPFQLFDLDDDGRISKGEALAANYPDACGWTFAQRREHILALFKAKDPAGLDEQEWLAGPASLQPTPPDAQLIERLRDQFFDADTDSDGRLSVAEMKAAKAYAPPGGWTRPDRAAAIADLLAAVDADRDHMVSFDETLCLLHEACVVAPAAAPAPTVAVRPRPQ